MRDAVIGGASVKKGEYMAISKSAIVAVADTPEDAVIAMVKSVDDLDDHEVISVFVGNDVTEDKRAELAERLSELCPDHEIMLYNGGQEVYSYLIAIE